MGWKQSNQLCQAAQKDFQIDFGQMALLVNEEATKRALANHIAAWKNQFETENQLCGITYALSKIMVLMRSGPWIFGPKIDWFWSVKPSRAIQYRFIRIRCSVHDGRMMADEFLQASQNHGP